MNVQCVCVCFRIEKKNDKLGKTDDCRAFTEANTVHSMLRERQRGHSARQIRTKLTSPSDKETDRVSQLMERRVRSARMKESLFSHS